MKKHEKMFFNICYAALLLSVHASASRASGVSYRYDSLNRLIKADYGNGASIFYTYDAAGNRLSAISAPPNDHFADRILLSGESATSNGVNTGGTRQAQEPQINGNPGGSSIWWSWTAPATGYVRFSTLGSSFRSLMAVYTGSSLGTLSLVAAGSGSEGDGNCQVTIAAQAGTTYQIAIDGHNGATGTLLVSVAPAPPQITSQPQAKPALVGENIVLSTGAIGNGPLSFQWYRNGVTISGATNNSLILGNLQLANAGTYKVVVSNSAGSTSSSNVVLSVYDPTALATIYVQSGDQRLFSWLVNSNQFVVSKLLRNGQPVAVDWRIFGQGDFNNDGKLDIAFQNTTSGKLATWFMDGTNFLGSALLRDGIAPTLSWRAVSAADFNDDGESDVLFQNTDGRTAVWLMEGSGFISSILLRNGIAARIGWQIAGTGDFNGDAQTDVVWQHADGRIALWRFSQTTFLDSALLRAGPAESTGWKIRGVGDVNLDEKPDLLWQNANGKAAVWFFDGMSFSGSAPLKDVGPTSLIVGPK